MKLAFHKKTEPQQTSSTPIMGITQELYVKNVELAHTNKTLALLRSIDSLVLDQSNSISSIAQAICDQLLYASDYAFAAIGIISEKSSAQYLIEGLSITQRQGTDFKHTDWLKTPITISDEFASGGQFELVSLDGPLAKNLHDHLGQNTLPISKELTEMGVHRIVVNKLSSHDKLLGILLVGVMDATNDLKPTEIDYLARISEACGVAFDNKLLNAEIQKVAKELAKSNTKLQALDEAKDEFISMASHQLRTPLTSIKGYLSMVLEGDVGKVPPQQKEMLETAFTSAQRMVYLISDLLNVSRLQTGKFVIEPIESYLPDVVDQELKQLREAIAAKKIKLTYNKPKTFSKVKLDETKIRQVIMNFTDNALYYTPAGGEVKLELNETAKSVEFTVTDNGIGVPKAEQHKLFAKFYRAGNARKARPDGTGLGLFMAKKVIIASGGAIIFKTKEGKGSTFGFTFPKSKVGI